MSNCSNHRKDVLGQNDMKHLAEDVGNLHYESLFQFLYHLSKKIEEDSIKDYQAERKKLASLLQYLGMSIYESSLRAEKVWKLVKPHMEK